MGNFLKFNDLGTFSLLDPNLVKVKDDYEGAFKPESGERTHHTGMGTVPGQQLQQQQSAYPSAKGLVVKIAATHSGIITRNNGFYLPDRMKKGADTFTESFGKPILLHHNDKGDNVGRVIASEYVDTSGAIIDKYNGLVVRNRYGDEVGTIKDSLIKDFVSDRMPFGQQVDVVCSLLKDSVLEDAGYSGLGYIQLLADITDPAAIQKLLDGRYLTGSVGATTNKAVCSVCKSDWTKGGPCEHKPGGVYDDAKCFIIAGDLIYDEYSFVNVPADRHSKVLELHYNGIQDSIEIANDYKGRIYEVRLEFPQYDSVTKEENSMAKKDANKEDGNLNIQDSANTDPAPNTENADGAQDTQVTDATDKTEVVTDEVVTDESGETQTVEDGVNDNSNEESIEDFVVRVVDAEGVSQEEEDKAYDLLWDEVLAAVKDGELVEELVKDAKLSTEKRNKLPKSAFCGPNKSFPVNDCAHVTAARRLLGRAKVSDETKKRISACIERKAKLKNCGSASTTKKDSVEAQDGMHHARIMQVILAAFEENRWSPEEDPALTDEDKKMLSDLLKRLSTLVGKDAFVTAAQAEGLAVVQDQALLDEIVSLEETVIGLQDSLDATRKEYANLYQDLESLQDSLVEEKSKTRKVQEDHLSTLKALNDTKVVEDSDWTSLTDEGLVTELDRLSKEVDMVKITDKLGDGMSRIPEGEVSDPTEISDSTQTPKSKEVSLTDLSQIQEQYYTILFRDGQIKAEAFIKRLQDEGRLPQSFDNIQGGSN